MSRLATLAFPAICLNHWLEKEAAIHFECGISWEEPMITTKTSKKRLQKWNSHQKFKVWSTAWASVIGASPTTSVVDGIVHPKSSLFKSSTIKHRTCGASAAWFSRSCSQHIQTWTATTATIQYCFEAIIATCYRRELQARRTRRAIRKWKNRLRS